jgi:small-conductance mechanosensitive channel
VAPNLVRAEATRADQIVAHPRTCIIERYHAAAYSVTERGDRGTFRVYVVHRAARNIGYSAWILLSAVLAIVAAVLSALTSFATLGALSFAAALATLYVVLGQLHRKPVRGGLLTGLVLSMTTLLLTLLLVLAALGDSQ